MRVMQVDISSLEELTGVLDEAGFAGRYDVHEEPAPLFGYMGEERREQAQVIIRRRYLQPASNDVGFCWNLETGCYDMIVCDYDTPVAQAVQRAHHSVILRSGRG